MAKAATKAPAAKAPSKSEIYANISEATGVSKKEVAAVFEALGAEISKALGKKGPGVFQIPGLCKIKLKYSPATKERTGPDPFNPGQTRVFKAKKASNKVKVLPLKGLKDMAPAPAK